MKPYYVSAPMNVVVFQCPGTPAMAARHVGGGPGLIDEHEALRLQIGLPIEPIAAASQDAGTVLF